MFLSLLHVDGLYVQRVVDAAWESSDKGGVWVNVPS